MVASAIFVLDAKGKILISRNYRGDVTRANADRCGARARTSVSSSSRLARAALTAPARRRFALKIQETDPVEMKPVFTEDGVNYVYVQHNNLYVLALTRKNSNVMIILVFLEKLVEVRRGCRDAAPPPRTLSSRARPRRSCASTLGPSRRSRSATTLCSCTSCWTRSWTTATRRCAHALSLTHARTRTQRLTPAPLARSRR